MTTALTIPDEPARRKALQAQAGRSPLDLAEAARADQARYWPTPAEWYFIILPTLAADGEAAVDLIYHEYLLRERNGERPEAATFFARFPAHADALARQLEVHAALGSLDADSGSVSDTAVEGASPPAGVRPPAEVPGYDLEREFGRGATGVVYLARQTRLNRHVALKMILAGPHATPEQLVRFLAEAELIARVQHPQVVQVFDFGRHDDRPYFALEFLPGGTLEQRTRGQPQPPHSAAATVAHLARGVQAAHDVGVIHRDLKPANVLFAADGTPKVTDFGLARRSSSDLTHSGSVVGTPSYMAPEQARGSAHQVLPAADVYSLGAVLYEQLTGRPPFKGASVLETLKQVSELEPVPVRRLTPDVPRDLETVCLKCLEKDPAMRYARAAELADDLERFGRGEPVLARPVRWPGRLARWARRRPTSAALWLVSTAAAAALLGVGVWTSARLGRAAGDVITARELAYAQQYYSLLAAVRERIASPEPGWTVAGRAELREAAQTPARSRNLAELRRLAVALAAPDLTPAGRATDGTFGERLIAAGDAFALGENKHFFINSVWLLDPADGTERRKLKFGSWAPFMKANNIPDGCRALAASADGRRLAAGTRSGRLHLWDLPQPTDVPQSWTAHPTEVRRAAFHPDGASLYSLAERGVKRWTVPAGTRAAELDAAPLAERWHDLAISPTGDRLAVAGKALTFWEPGTLRPLPPLPGLTGQPGLPRSWTKLAYGDDGRRLAAAGGGEVVLLDPHHPESVRTLRTPRDLGGTVTSVALAGPLMATGVHDTGRVQLWDADAGRLVADLHVGPDLGRVAFQTDTNGRLMLAVSAEHAVRLFAVSLPEERRARSGGITLAAALSADGRLATLVDRGAQHNALCTFWEPKRRDADYLPNDAAHPVWHPRGTAVAWALKDNLAIVPAAGPQRTWPAKGVAGLSYDPSGRLWAALSDRVTAWDEAGNATTWVNKLGDMANGRAAQHSVAAGRTRAVAGGFDGAIRLLDENVKLLDTKQLGTAPVERVAIAADEALAAAGTEAGVVHLLNLPSLAPVAELRAHRGRVTGLALRGGRLASGADDGTVAVWDCVGRAPAERLRLRLPDAVVWLDLAADGSTLFVLVRGEAAVRVWNFDHLEAEYAALGLGS